MKRVFFKRAALFTAALLILTLLIPIKRASALATSAQSAVLIELTTGNALYEQSADTRLPMASTTKIMTAYVALKHGDIGDLVKIPLEAQGVEGSSLYINEGEIYSLDELLYGLLMHSGNDAATAIALHISGSVEDFADLMNEEAALMGLKDTQFKNPSGLDAQGHYTTARELAVIMAHALEYKDFIRYISAKSYTIEESESHPVKLLYTKNRILQSYEGAIGGKTGYTISSGRSLVTAAERKGVTLIAVTINDRDDWDDHAAMFDYGFSKAVVIDPMDYVASGYILPVAGGGSIKLHPTNVEPIVMTSGEAADVSVKILLPNFVYSGISIMQQVGEAHIFVNGELASVVPIRASESIMEKKEEKSIFQLLFELF